MKDVRLLDEMRGWRLKLEQHSSGSRSASLSTQLSTPNADNLRYARRVVSVPVWDWAERQLISAPEQPFDRKIIYSYPTV